MRSYSFVHLADQSVLSEYDAVEARENADTATALALLGEIDARRLYVPAGYPSMYAYCLQARHMSEDRAYKRIRVARAARKFPALYPAVAEGRLHLSAVFLLEPYLSPDCADELIAAATHRTKAQVELLLARRFPKPDLPALVQPLRVPTPDESPTSGVEQRDDRAPAAGEDLPAPGRVVPSGPGNRSLSMDPLPVPPEMRSRLAPLSAERFGVQFSMDQPMHDRLRYVQSLLGVTVASGDLAKVFALALECLQDKLEKQRFAKCSRPGRRRGSSNARYIPSEIKRAVWKRDEGRCTFVGTGGRRCDARESLEFDHVDPVARGGRSTLAGVRLLCRAHNQHAAESTFGPGFMRGKRERARDRAGRSSPIPPAIDAPAPPA
jgi:5-methylcytosine-specific restriction endonuclease McrA